jgi:hypothetical protein
MSTFKALFGSAYLVATLYGIAFASDLPSFSYLKEHGTKADFYQALDSLGCNSLGKEIDAKFPSGYENLTEIQKHAWRICLQVWKIANEKEKQEHSAILNKMSDDIILWYNQ